MFQGSETTALFSTNWRGYRIAAWIGQFCLASAVVILATALAVINSLDNTIISMIMDIIGAMAAAMLSLWVLQQRFRLNEVEADRY